MSAVIVDIPKLDESHVGPGLDDLQSLLRSFMESTQQLEQTHTVLQKQVALLQEELVEARAKLRRSESLAALGQMAAGIAHEIRNPLGSIQLFVQVLEDELAHDESHREVCSKISRAVRRMDAIVGDVLQFARDTRIKPHEVTLGRLVDDALHSCESIIQARDVIVVKYGDAQLSAEADASLLNIALSNIIRNAIEAVLRDRQPTLSITCSKGRALCPDGQRRDRAVIAIQDNGPGVEQHVVDRMFNPFFTTREAGTGLGLAIVHRIVDAHGGHVTVTNTQCNASREIAGARFELAVPVCQPTDSPTLNAGSLP